MPFGTILQDDQNIRRFKSVLLVATISLFIFVLIARLVYVQVVLADENIRLSKENAMRLRIIIPPRGRIFDRHGRVLARNRPSYSICVLPYKLRNRKTVISSLCSIADSTGTAVFDSTELEKLFRKASYRRFDATRLMEDVSMELVSIIEEHSMELPGIIVETESRREYPLGKAAFHVLGYMSEIPERQFDSLKEKGYFYGDLIGKSGIERRCESIFRGIYGREYIEVNAYGKSLGPIKTIPRIDPIPGNDVKLSIDGTLQVAAEFAFPDTLKGALVALNPRSGEVLAMYSSPSVDPNIFSMSSLLRSKNWSAIATDSNLPLNNRAIAGTYTPGSTFKLISALTALEEGHLTGSSKMPVPCTGGYRIGSRIAHCWKLSGHGRLTLIGAVQQSCNIYMYQLGLRFGDKVINHYATMMGLGAPTGIDIPGERGGWLSGEEAYNKRFARRGWKWTTGLVLDLAIGQTQVVTPIQLALMVGGLGNSNTLYTPFLIEEERSNSGMLINRHDLQVKRILSFDSATVAIMHEALGSVIRPGGTGGRAAVPGVPVGGKTGSAENPQGDRTHALFVACAPIENPAIAIAVVAENAGHGGSVAAPIAGDVLRYFFSETEEGREVVRQLGVDSTTTARLAERVKPIVAEVQRYYPLTEEP
jgi:penicillin-binding protein 2